MSKKVLLSLSGGMDSATLLGEAIERYGVEQVLAVSFFYPSKHNVYELASAFRLSAHCGVEHQTINVAPLFTSFKSNLLKTGGVVPEGHYEAESMKATVVPCRNLIFLSILAGLAESLEIPEVWLGAHAGDHHIYPDCRSVFIESAAQTVSLATDGKVTLRAPYLMVNKGQILKEGLARGTPYALTRTCYKDQPIACGKCGSCQERLEAFKLNGMEDPLDYVSRELMPK